MHNQPYTLRRPAPGRRALSGLLLGLLALLLLAPLGVTPRAYAADQVQDWDSDNVTVQINPDSTFDVTEQQGFNFRQGTFHGSYRDIDSGRLTGISAQRGAHSNNLVSCHADSGSGPAEEHSLITVTTRHRFGGGFGGRRPRDLRAGGD